MQSLNLKQMILVLCWVSLFALVLPVDIQNQSAMAAEGGGSDGSEGEGTEGEGSEGDTESSDGEEPKMKEVETGGSGPKMHQYSRLFGELATLEAQVKDTRKQVKDLIQKKVAAKDRKTKHELIQQLLEVHKVLKEKSKKYNKGRLELKYRFPEKGDFTERRYLPVKEQSIEQLETEMGLDQQLAQLKKTVDQKYKSFMVDEEDSIRRRRKKVQRMPTHANEDPSQRLLLSK